MRWLTLVALWAISAARDGMGVKFLWQTVLSQTGEFVSVAAYRDQITPHDLYAVLYPAAMQDPRAAVHKARTVTNAMMTAYVKTWIRPWDLAGVRSLRR